MHRLLLLIAFNLLITAAVAEQPETGPVITGFGPTVKVENRDTVLPTDHVYRAVMDLAAVSDGPVKLNRYLESAARFLNMHARNGVKPEQMQLAVVVHGEALNSVLSSPAYQQRYAIDNPNLPMIQALQQAGVVFYVCGQSAAFRGIDKTELAPSVQLALSAMTMLTTLQQRGYALLP